MKSFSTLTKSELWQLRQEIVLGSLFVSDYKNSFDFNAHDISEFFDGYTEYLYELALEYGGRWIHYDSINHLLDWFYSYDDLSWVRFAE